VTGLFGGRFDPPHNGHVALARTAKAALRLDDLVVLVAARPGHKGVHAPADDRVALARAAFPDLPVELDEHARTIDTLRARRWSDPVFIVGADQLVDFPTWKEPAEVLELARLGVATRPGYPSERLESALAALGHPDRVTVFELEPVPVSGTEVRRRVAAGEPIDDLVPRAVAAEIEARGLYRDERLHSGRSREDSTKP
jgi:nicotinate-nucleotide adenylyltransferase